MITGHFGTKTFRHQGSSAPVQNGAEVSRDNSAPVFLLVPTVRTPVPKYLETLRHHPSKIHGYCFVKLGLLLVGYYYMPNRELHSRTQPNTKILSLYS